MSKNHDASSCRIVVKPSSSVQLFPLSLEHGSAVVPVPVQGAAGRAAGGQSTEACRARPQSGSCCGDCFAGSSATGV